MKDVVAGREPVLEALRSGREVLRLYVADAARREGTVVHILRAAEERGVETRVAPVARLEGLAPGVAHQGVVALCGPRPYATLDDVLSGARGRGEDPFLLLLDGVQDPGNLGAILRSADGAGVHAVVIPGRGAAGLTPTVHKTSAGAASHVPVVRVAKLVDAVQALRREGVAVAGAEAGGGRAYWDEDLRGALAIALGSEGGGLSGPVRKHCDLLVHVPLFGSVSSLNVSVAAALLVFERRRQMTQNRSRNP